MVTIRNSLEEYTQAERNAILIADQALSIKAQGDELDIEETRVIIAAARLRAEPELKIALLKKAASVKTSKARVPKEKTAKVKITKKDLTRLKDLRGLLELGIKLKDDQMEFVKLYEDLVI